jgi:NAD(P)H-hydrate epimerase
MRLPFVIPSTSQIRELESNFIKTCNAQWGQVLMELAGREAASLALELWQRTAGSVIVFCGRGNNGGDGMVVARYLYLWGVPVSVLLVPTDKKAGEFEMNSDEANVNRSLVQQFGIPLSVTNKLPTDEAPSIVIDALLGTGINHEVKGDYRSAIDSINLAAVKVLSIDLPSGINSDTGQIKGAAVKADNTITFGYLKAGLLNEPGAGLAGELSVVDIGLPNVEDYQSEIHDEKSAASLHLAVSEYVRERLPSRPTDSHKGTYGTVLTIAGSLGMTGAPMLAGETALRVGAGLVLLAVPKSLIAQLPSKEVIYRALPETEALSISLKALNILTADLEKATSIILGPGISTEKETVQFVQKFVLGTLSQLKKPCLIDADALNAISMIKEDVSFPDGNKIVLTPHPKELSRLLAVSTSEIQSDRVAFARKAATKFNCVVVLKGARTIVADCTGQAFINPTGNAGMATAGAGDVLSGTIGGLLAQGLEPLHAAACGVYLHGMAGDIAAEDIGETGLVASDISMSMPFALSAVKSGECSSFEESLKKNKSDLS